MGWGCSPASGSSPLRGRRGLRTSPERRYDGPRRSFHAERSQSTNRYAYRNSADVQLNQEKSDKNASDRQKAHAQKFADREQRTSPICSFGTFWDWLRRRLSSCPADTCAKDFTVFSPKNDRPRICDGDHSTTPRRLARSTSEERSNADNDIPTDSF